MKGSQIATHRGSPRKTIKKKLLRKAWFDRCSQPYLVEQGFVVVVVGIVYISISIHSKTF
jgi:hypothetical protein